MIDNVIVPLPLDKEMLVENFAKFNIFLGKRGEGKEDALHTLKILEQCGIRGHEVRATDLRGVNTHYSELPKFWESTFRYYQNVQVFAQTQCLELLSYLVEFLEANERYRKDIAVYTFRCHNGSKYRNYRYDYESLKYSLNQEIEIR